MVFSEEMDFRTTMHIANTTISGIVSCEEWDDSEQKWKSYANKMKQGLQEQWGEETIRKEEG